MLHFSRIPQWLPLACLLLSAVSSADEVDFNQDIAPILNKNCVACHNTKNTEGGLNLESHETLMQGGDSGEAVVASELEESYLISRVTGEIEPIMPPDDNSVGARRLTQEEIRLLQAWIGAGAKPGQKAAPNSIQWQTLPDTLHPSYALATSLDGQQLAFGRGNNVWVASQYSTNPSDTPARMLQLIDPELDTLMNANQQATHLDIVQSIAFSPDSHRLATGGYRNVKIWRRETLIKPLLAGLSATAHARVVSPTGGKIAYVSSGTALEIVDVASGTAIRFLKTHTKPIKALVWIDDDSLLSCDEQQGWQVTNLSNQQSRSVKVELPILIEALARVDDNRIFALDSNHQLYLVTLDASADEASVASSIQSIDAHSNLCCLTSLEGKTPLLAVGDAEGVVTVLDGASLKPLIKVETGAKPASMHLSTNRLLTVGDQRVKLWNLSDGNLLAEIERDYLSKQQLLFADKNIARQNSFIDRLNKQLPDLKAASEKEVEAKKKVQETRDKSAADLAAGAKEVEEANAGVTQAEQQLSSAQAALAEAQKKVEEANTLLASKKEAVMKSMEKKSSLEEELAKREQALAAATDSSDRAAALIPKLESEIELESTRLADMKSQFDTLQTTLVLPPVRAAAFSLDGSQLLLASADQRVRVFSAFDGTPTNVIVTERAIQQFLPVTGQPQEMAGISSDGNVISWNLDARWILEHSIGRYDESPFSDRITALDFSPDGQWLAVGSGPPSRFGEVKLISPDSGEIVRDLGEAHSDTVLSVRFSPDGRRLATGGADKLCKTFDVDSGELIRSFEGHTHHILSITWQDDGQVLATASADASIKTWRAETGEQIRTISGFKKEVTAISFVGQTTQILAGCADGSIRLYNSDDGKLLRSFAGANNAIFCLALSADEKTVSAGGQSGRISTWQIEDAKLTSTLPANVD